MELIIVTGLSGAGKSQAVNCMEDLGYYCVDNMPPTLINEFIELAESGGAGIDKAAFVVDIRQGRFLKDLRDCLDSFAKQGREFKVMFLEASDAVLIRRYQETRRAHPLDKISVKAGIDEERQRLADIRARASYVIDTSYYKIADLNEEIKRLLSSELKPDSFSITVESFGYKYGVPQEMDWMLDARFISNPFYMTSMRHLTGNNMKVREFVMRHDLARELVDSVAKLLESLVPGYIKEGKYSLKIAVGCTGGRHRSVAIANELADRLRACGKHVVVLHRDL